MRYDMRHCRRPRLPKLSRKVQRLKDVFPDFEGHDEFVKGCGQAMEALGRTCICSASRGGEQRAAAANAAASRPLPCLLRPNLRGTRAAPQKTAQS
jgi:hypothetical protein